MTPSARRLRVLVLIDMLPPRGGGAERLAVALATHLPRERCEVLVCVTRGAGGALVDQLDAAGVEHFSLGRRRSLDVLPFARLWRTLRRRRVDVLHTHKFGSNVWGTLVGTLARVPVIVAHEHTWSYEGQRLRRLLDRHVVARFADAFVAVSSRDRERMIALEGVPAGKIVLVPNAYVPRPGSGGAGGTLHRELGLPEGAPVVGTAAVMRPQKALDMLVDAFAQLSEAVPDAHLVLAGDGPLRESLERRVDRLGLAARVRFAGYRDDIDRLLRTVDVAVMSSDFEGAPLFPLECMAHDVPLVSTDVGGIRDLLEDGRSVVLVPPRRPAELARALEALLRSPERRASIAGEAARGLPGYEIGRVAERFADLYEQLGKGPPADRSGG
jgi:glycosyltransferase involved in cell wall biosynthesis